MGKPLCKKNAEGLRRQVKRNIDPQRRKEPVSNIFLRMANIRRMSETDYQILKFVKMGLDLPQQKPSFFN